MNIFVPGISQHDFNYAVECLDACKQNDAKEYGFNYPYFTPGGAYGKQWWQLDSSLALCGYKWINRKFAETSAILLINLIFTLFIDVVFLMVKFLKKRHEKRRNL